MALIKSISGIRGTIGGKPGEGLSPLDLVKYTAAYCLWVKKNTPKERHRIVVGRDARISGEMVSHLVLGTLSAMGCDVLYLGLATTPTTEIAVAHERAEGGIILTASHNPKQWNALKLLNAQGEFLTANDGRHVLELAEKAAFDFAPVEKIGQIQEKLDYTNIHIQQILHLPLVDIDAIKQANFKIAIDGVNSVGGIAIPLLLKALGVEQVLEIYCTPTGDFPHNPEPLPAHLTEISETVRNQNADLGFAVDPDVDRLAIVDENGNMFGEEYTLVAVADYILQHKPGNTVSNLSSSRALRDLTRHHSGKYSASAVGEVNVVAEMKRTQAVIGGEGNGGVIYPDLHYGRDALVGIALFLTHLAQSKLKCSELRAGYPNYFMSKNKIQLTPQTNVDELLLAFKEKNQAQGAQTDTRDGVKVDFESQWVHLRKSNTEPIIRVYAESQTQQAADNLANQVIKEIEALM